MRPAVTSIRNLYRSAYRSIVKKWRHDKKKASPEHEPDPHIQTTTIENDVICEEVSNDSRFEKKSMHEFHGFRCLSLHSSVDNIFNFSGRKSGNHTPSSPSLKKTKSRKSWPDSIPATPTTPKTPGGPASSGGATKSADSTPSHPFLSKCESRKGPTPIMFSNSSGMLKPPAIEKQLECTLEELCFGCQKKMKVTRAVVQDTGLMAQEEELVTIQVKPGWKKGTTIKFEGLGNERPGAYPADIIFVVSEKRHPLFRREGDDLELALEIPLIKALTGCIISLPLLGGDQMTLTIDDIIYPGYQKIISGHGMPVSKHEGKSRGNLKLTFLVEFPDFLTHDQRSEILSILEGSIF